MSNWFLFNGKWYNQDENVLSIKNRGFLYGDGVFETMRTFGTSVLFFENHIDRLHNSLDYLSIPISEELQPENLKNSIKQLLNKNKWFSGGRVRLTVFRDSDGLYTPKNNKVGILLQGSELKNDFIYPIFKGKLVGLFSQEQKAITRLSSIKSISSLLYVKAGLFCKQNNFDDCFIVNSNNNIIECLSSNIFLVKNRKIFYPNSNSGSIDGVMQKVVYDIFIDLGFEMVESNITKEDVLGANEIITTNAIQGVQYILGYENTRYFSRVAQQVSDRLNFIANDYLIRVNSTMD